MSPTGGFSPPLGFFSFSYLPGTGRLQVEFRFEVLLRQPAYDVLFELHVAIKGMFWAIEVEQNRQCKLTRAATQVAPGEARRRMVSEL